MLSRTHRFHGYGSLKGVYSRGITIRSGLVSARFMNRSATKSYRVAVVVSKKVHKSAVVRNRIRRRLFEIVRRHSELIPIGTDLVLTVFSEQVAVQPADKLESSIIDMLQKIAKQQNNTGQSAQEHAIVKPELSKKGDT